MSKDKDHLQKQQGREERCRCLKTKMFYVAGNDSVNVSVPSTTAQYWCIQTMSQVGDDGGLVVPDHCNSSRACFESDAFRSS